MKNLKWKILCVFLDMIWLEFQAFSIMNYFEISNKLWGFLHSCLNVQNSVVGLFTIVSVWL